MGSFEIATYSKYSGFLDHPEKLQRISDEPRNRQKRSMDTIGVRCHVDENGASMIYTNNLRRIDGSKLSNDASSL